jgi:O-Antigen ligase
VDVPHRLRPAPEALTLALAVPFLLVHERYNPDFTVGLGSTTVSISLADVAVVAVVAAAASAARSHGVEALRRGLVLLVPVAALTAIVLAFAVLGPALTDGYPLAAKLVSAVKFAEYAMLAVAVPLIVRKAEDALAAVWALVATACLAALVGALQLIGLIGNLDHTPAGRRMPSFLGYHDFAALAGVTLGVGIAIIAAGRWRDHRSLTVAAVTSGCIGVVIAGALATVVALVAAAALAVVSMRLRGTLTIRRVVAVTGMVAIVLTGSLTLRSSDVGAFLGFLGSSEESTTQIQTYSQRTVLTYIGARIFAAHPLTGVGWQGSELPAAFEPFLDDARKRFPDVSVEALPSRNHPWGVQNAYVQAAADMGVLGLAALVTVVVTALWLALRLAFRPLPAASFALGVGIALLVCAMELAALGLVPGVPATALLWLAVGGAVALPRVSASYENVDRMVSS